MLSFKSILLKSIKNGEKSGWTYIEIPPDIITQLKLKNRREFRIKGTIDDVKFERMACYPVKEGNFIIALNAEIRKKIGKKEGATVIIKLQKDESGALQATELLECLKDEPEAQEQFNSLTQAHRNYFHNYINSAKGADTKAGRIVNTVNAMLKKMDFGAMIRGLKKK